MKKSILILLPLILLFAYFINRSFSSDKTETVDEGKRLFLAKCACCHNKDMIHKSTGPALGCIEGGKNPRPRAFLKYFIRNNNGLLQVGNKAANCMYDTFGKSNMTVFPELSDSEINSILDYIQAETQAKNICKYDDKITGRNYDCALSAPDFEIDTTYFNILNYISYKHEGLETDLRDENDVIRNIKGWQVVNPFEINIDTDMPEQVQSFVLSTQKNGFVLHLNYDNESELFTDYTIDGKVYMPINQPILIVAFAKQKNGNYIYGVQKTTIQASNRYTLILKPITAKDLERTIKQY